MVDLKEAVAAAKGEMTTIDMESTRQPIENVSAAPKPASRPRIREAGHLRRAVASYGVGGD